MKQIAVFLVFLQIQSAFAYSSRLDLVRVGGFSKSAEVEWRALEPKLRREIEDNRVVPIQVATPTLRITKQQFSEYQDGKELARLVGKGHRSSLTTNDQTKLEKLRAKLRDKSWNGNLLQRSYFDEAYHLWMKGERASAERRIKAAVQIHPESAGDYLGDWSQTEILDNKTLAFTMAIETARASVVRGCDVTFSGIEGHEGLWVDGFKLGKFSHFHFQVGRVYRVIRGPEYEPSLLSCLKQGKQIHAVSNNKSKDAAFESLKKHSATVLFVHEDTKQLFLESFDSKNEVHRYALNSSDLPQTPEFETWLRKFAGDVSAHPNPQPAMPSLIEQAESPWYKSWVVWAVAGVVTAGVATYLITKDSGHGNVGSSTGGIKISLE